VRAPSSGCIVARAVMWSRDRGCKGHRILRRAPSDGRHPRSYEPSSFTRQRKTVILAAPSTSEERAKARPRGRQERRGDRDVRGSIASAPWEQNAHDRLAPRGASRGTRPNVDPPKRSSSVVKRSVPRSSRAEPRLCGVSTQRKAAAANRERARCGYTQVVRVAEVDRTHRASCSLGDRKVSWWHAGR
jgi:hypothetical protein